MSDIPPPFNAIWFLGLIGLFVGACIGSFVTMLSYRLPRRMSIVAPRSHCTFCNTTLSTRELVPVLSWVVQKGRCHTCGVPMGKRYVLIEIATALLTMAAFMIVGFSLLLVLPVLVIMALVTALAIYIERRA